MRKFGKTLSFTILGKMDTPYYTGGHEHTGKWIWDGVFNGPFTTTDWSPNEPNNYQGRSEDCLVFGTDGLWNDKYCVFSHRYICQKLQRDRCYM